MPPLQVTDIQKTLESGKALSQKSRTMLRNTLVHNTVTMAQNAATQQGRAREREFGNERERDECSGILRSEGKSPLVLVLLERLALTHEYFILLMFKSHHL